MGHVVTHQVVLTHDYEVIYRTLQKDMRKERKYIAITRMSHILKENNTTSLLGGNIFVTVPYSCIIYS